MLFTKISASEKNLIFTFLKYAVIGISAAILDFWVFISTLTLLNNQSGGTALDIFNIGHIAIANSLGIIFGFLWSFFLNKYWAFRSNGYPLIQFLLMIVLVIINVIITSLLIPLISSILHTDIEWAKIIMQIFVVSWNYLIYHYFIFKSH